MTAERGYWKSVQKASEDFRNSVGRSHHQCEVSGSERADDQTDFLDVGQTLDSEQKTDGQDQTLGHWRCNRLDVADTRVGDLTDLAAGTGLDTGPAEVDRTVVGMEDS